MIFWFTPQRGARDTSHAVGEERFTPRDPVCPERNTGADRCHLDRGDLTHGVLEEAFLALCVVLVR